MLTENTHPFLHDTAVVLLLILIFIFFDAKPVPSGTPFALLLGGEL